jgi:ubiquinone/menaquinone biosynthesis C-methylase UbiE
MFAHFLLESNKILGGLMFREDKYASWQPHYNLNFEGNLINQVLKEMNRTVEEDNQPSSLEQKIVLYSHLSSVPVISTILQEGLGKRRQEDAFLHCKDKGSYHALANLYYALQGGENTLGHPLSNGVYVDGIRNLREQGISNPKVLLLGFSSNYCIENLAAMFHLIGFKKSKIIAFDKSNEPLDHSKKTFGESLFSTKLEYKQGNALVLPFEEEEFDAVVTHFFFTHIKTEDRTQLLNGIYRVLKPQRKFLNQEILIPETVNMDQFASYFRTLATSYEPSSNHSIRSQIGNFMHKFGSFPVHAFTDKQQLKAEFSQGKFLIETEEYGGATLYTENGARMRAEKVSIMATKSS